MLKTICRECLAHVYDTDKTAAAFWVYICEQASEGNPVTFFVEDLSCPYVEILEHLGYIISNEGPQYLACKAISKESDEFCINPSVHGYRETNSDPIE